MILLSKLRLTHFGKFDNAEFSFSDVTVFCGDNESGKTTLFDAIFTVAANPRKNTKLANLERYDSDISVSPEWNGAVPKKLFTEDEFIHLSAIRSGDITFDISPTASWLSQVKKKLFTGGIDPQEIIRDLQKNYSLADRQRKFTDELGALSSQKAELSLLLNDKSARRNSILLREEALEAETQTLAAIAQEKAAIENNITKCKESLLFENQIRNRIETEAVFKLIDESMTLEKQVAESAVFAHDETSDLNRMIEAVGKIKSDMDKQHDRIQTRIADMQKAAIERDAKKEACSTQKNSAQTADKLIDKLDSFTVPSAQKTSWHIVILICSIATAAPGIAGIFLLPGNLRFILAAIALASAGFLFVKSRKTQFEPDTSAENTFVNKIKDEWIAAQTKNAGLSIAAISTTNGLRQFLVNQVKEYEILIREADRNDQACTDLEAEIRQLALSESSLNTETIKQQTILDDWLRSRGCTSTQTYSEKVNDIQRKNELLAHLRSETARRGITDIAAAKRDCERLLNEYDAKGIPKTGLLPEQVRALDIKLEQLSSQHKVLIDKEHYLTASIMQATGQIKGELLFLTDELVDLRKRVAGLESQISAMEFDRQAAQYAIGIFKEIEADAQFAFENLADDISTLMSDVAPFAGTVRIAALNSESITCSDAGGTMRPMADLSSGARDLFVFAARLALAQKHESIPRLLVLDEPFGTLDNTRRSAMTNLLAHTALRNEWQIIMFTKDKLLAEDMAEKCKAKVYRFTDKQWQ